MFIQTRDKTKNKRFLACPFVKKKNKRAVSIMIGYILLITFAVVIAGVVFQWLKTYVPKQGLECPDGVSLYLSEYNDSEVGNLSLTLRNNGKFSIGGIFIYYSNSSNQTIAPYDLSKKLIEDKPRIMSLNPGISLGAIDKNEFDPGNETKILFNITEIEYIYAIEIIPTREQVQKNKKFRVSCGNSKTKKILNLNITELNNI